MSSRRTLARVGALVAGTAAALSLGSVPASADGTKADIVRGGGENGYNVNLGQGSENQQTTLFKLNIEGGNTLRAYCVEISVNVDPSRSLFESPWDEFPNADSPFHANRDHINWVLHHGYPVNDLASLEQKLAEAGAEVHNGLDVKEAIAGTQAAVWHFSDGKDINRDDPSSSKDEGADADVLALYDYLTGESNVGIAEPAPALEVSPETAAGEAGERLGPFTVATTGEITEVTAELPEGVTLTDAEGNELGDIADGTEIYVDVPADAEDGTGSFSLNATAHLATGRLFVSEDYQAKPAQSLIVASSEDTSLSAKASVEWTAVPEEEEPKPEEPTEVPSPSEQPSAQPSAPATEPSQPAVTPSANTDDLADTGASPLVPLLIGLGLVGAGTGAILLQRRKKNA
ncbi:thioester domain-containing protein [Saccharomonospora xinjiangensis]|uniref:TQXA domain protein n=1 Tax=Saccharomonospora xinjiangensis XJ-54 TaxID=882086 RepID=I0V2A1_9PSEU|nr:thioester domain-containing protein [Saccharomonospora xinjiangensis]EID54254.1 TQXA domain protein [Saccharomonospora xinjiangensis XJ-54]